MLDMTLIVKCCCRKSDLLSIIARRSLSPRREVSTCTFPLRKHFKHCSNDVKSSITSCTIDDYVWETQFVARTGFLCRPAGFSALSRGASATSETRRNAVGRQPRWLQATLATGSCLPQRGQVIVAAGVDTDSVCIDIEKPPE